MTEEKKAPPPSSSFVKKGDRQIFTVELRQGETTIVSWKKLMKDANNINNNDGNNKGSNSSSAPTHVHHALDSTITPGQPAEVEEKDPTQPNRFSAVIEKIERLYMGKDSSDEEDMRDVHDDQYDTEDSFIDDAELDEYFEVDNSAIKHDGFFVNRGKLERINEPPILPNQQPKKRHRKDIPKNLDDNNDDQGSSKHVKGSRQAYGKTASLKGKNTPNSSQNLVAPGEYYKDLKVQNRSDDPGNGISSKKKNSDTKSTLNPSVSLKASKDDVPGSVKEAKDADKQKTGVIQSKKIGDKYKDASGFLGASHQKYHEQGAHAHSNSKPGRSPSNINDSKTTSHSKEKKVMRELPDLNLSEEKSTMQVNSEYMPKKDGSSVRTKTSVLEKAIHELEKMVAESRPPAMENQEADTTSQAVKRRLPRDIKLKLAKVARLAQASQGKVSTELLNRLMSILGHLMQLRTLKRNLKEMISTGLSAKQEKDVRFQRIKKEVVDMIRVQAPTLESKQQKAGASGDFQEFGPDGKAITKSKFSMDTALEDKICDLYDLFVDGLDESGGPQIRKLYAELAELWPTGCMDNHGIKHGICRAKERRRALHSKHKDQEKMKTKKLLVPKAEENVLPDTQQQRSREKVAPQSSGHAFTSVNKPVSYTSTTAQVSSPMNGLKQEKAGKSSSSSVDNVTIDNGGLTKKKVKRKPEHDLEGAHFGPEKKKPSSLMEEARPKSLKQSTGLHTKSKLHPTSIPGL